MNRWIVVPFAMLVGCGVSGTGGRSVFFDVALEALPASFEPQRFTTNTGWQVELDTATLAIGPVYAWELGSFAGSVLDPDDDELDLIGRLGEVLVPTAHAHPGDIHFAGGELRGEFLEQIAFDLLSGETVRVGRARGIAGEVRSVSVILDPPGSSARGDVDVLQGHHAWVSGTASRGRQVVPFAGGLVIPADGIDRKVDGVPIDCELDDGGTLVVGATPQVWLDDAHFELLTVDDASGEHKVITEDSQVAAAWFIGARSAGAFWARWTTDETFTEYDE